uniref:Uncharacterized protein n=1 Tax=Glossina palpalis gambiensis TaxID=67801 RepID=A0A1B0AZ23_9MUSC
MKCILILNDVQNLIISSHYSRLQLPLDIVPMEQVSSMVSNGGGSVTMQRDDDYRIRIMKRTATYTNTNLMMNDPHIVMSECVTWMAAALQNSIAM